MCKSHQVLQVVQIDTLQSWLIIKQVAIQEHTQTLQLSDGAVVETSQVCNALCHDWNIGGTITSMEEVVAFGDQGGGGVVRRYQLRTDALQVLEAVREGGDEHAQGQGGCAGWHGNTRWHAREVVNKPREPFR